MVGSFRKAHWLVFIPLALGAAFYAATTLWGGDTRFLEVSVFQYIFAPFALLAFWWLLLRVHRVPFLAIAFCVTGFLGGAWAEFAVPLLWQPGSFAIARLQGPAGDAASRVVREAVNASDWSSVEPDFYSVPLAFHTATEVEQWLANDAAPQMVVWGSGRYLVLSFPRQQPLRLSETVLGKQIPSLGVLELVTYVPAVGVSLKPLPATADFIAALSAGIANDNGAFFPSRNKVNTRETSLLAAARRDDLWRTAAHRALAWWRVGNEYFVRSLAAPSGGGLRLCALDAYTEALGLFRGSDNPELYAALHNNVAVLQVVRGVLGEEKGMGKAARRHYQYAIAAVNYPNRLRAPLRASWIARLNLRHTRRGAKVRKDEGLRRARGKRTRANGKRWKSRAERIRKKKTDRKLKRVNVQ